MLFNRISKLQYLILFTGLVALLTLATPVLAEDDDEDSSGLSQLYEKIYGAWNEHDEDKLFSYFSKNFVTGDGLSLNEYKIYTKKLWDKYPNITIENQKKTIRAQDMYASITGVDFFYGDSKEINEEIQAKGHLSAISQGQLFFQKHGTDWRIQSDRTNFELVTVYYGNAKEYLDQHLIYFSSPEQVTAAQQYSGTLYFVLPDNVKASASINQDLIQVANGEVMEDSFQVVSNNKLERLFLANEANKNELLSATILISKGLLEPKLDGVLYISKRVNVLPQIVKERRDEVVTVPFGTDEDDEDQKVN